MAQNNEALESLELRISSFLRYGVFASAGFLAIGWLWQLSKGEDRLSHFQVYKPESLVAIVRGAVGANDFAMLSIVIGLAILISLPIIRVLLTAVLFMKNKDWPLAAMATFVFAVLCLSFFLGVEL